MRTAPEPLSQEGGVAALGTGSVWVLTLVGNVAGSWQHLEIQVVHAAMMKTVPGNLVAELGVAARGVGVSILVRIDLVRPEEEFAVLVI